MVPNKSKSCFGLVISLFLLGIAFSFVLKEKIAGSFSNDNSRNEIFQAFDGKSLHSKQNQQAVEDFIRYYLTERLATETDIENLKKRWGTEGVIYQWSSPRVFEEFRSVAKIVEEQVRNDGLRRSVRILSAIPYRKDKDGAVWGIELELQDKFVDKEEVFYSRWIVRMQIDSDKKLAQSEKGENAENPFGLKIMRFGMLKKE